MIYYTNESLDPAFNLAVEETLFNDLSTEEPILLLWRNEPTVVIGRNQNAKEEIHSPYVEQKKIHLVRRLTGGGAVYHDLGNLNYTFISRVRQFGFDFQTFTLPILKTLRRLGIDAKLSGRNDLEIAARKFSGNAQFRFQDRLLHHGTLLFQTDLEEMVRVLNPEAEKYHSKAIASVRSRVVNIAEHLPEKKRGMALLEFRDFLLEALEEEYGSLRPGRELTSDQLRSVQELKRNKYDSWDWTWGSSPKYDVRFDRRFSWGKLSIGLTCERGRIGDCRFSGDFFALADPNLLSEIMIGLPLTREALSRALEEKMIQSVFPELKKEELLELLEL